MKWKVGLFCLGIVLAVPLAFYWPRPSVDLDAIYVATPEEVVDRMLELAEIRSGDVLYDLGCGDGRIPIAAAKKYGIKAFGFDLDPERIQESLENVEKNQVQNLVTIQQANIFELDLTGASVVTLYLGAEVNVKLIPQLEKMKPGSRIVSHQFDMNGIRPRCTIDFIPEGRRQRPIYLWVTPLEKERNL